MAISADRARELAAQQRPITRAARSWARVRLTADPAARSAALSRHFAAHLDNGRLTGPRASRTTRF